MLMKSALHKLEAAPLTSSFYDVLSSDEFYAACELIRAAIDLIWKRRARGLRPPRSFDYLGARYKLAYSSVGRLFILSSKSGRSLISSGFDAI